MLSDVSEVKMHRVRWGLTLGWCLLIISLFYDPLSTQLTEPDNLASPFRIDLESCVQLQGQCIEEIPYAMGASIFWGIVVPAAVLILLVFGHEFWRRICPLSFISQIPRSLGWQRKRDRTRGKTGKVRKELVKVDKNSWLGRNYLYLQLSLFFIGLCNRLLFVNSNRLALGLFLIVTILAALIVGFLYGGKSWCQYICPMAPVQQIYAQPRGLLNSTAHAGERQPITQSMCRTVSQDGKERSACVACQSPCIDIDAERTYWDELSNPQQQWLYYGYVGIAIGYFVYYFLYAGNWDYYASGAWAHEENQLANLLKPGFYLFNQPIAIPKLAAVPLTLAAFTLASYGIGRIIENRYKAYQRRHHHLADSLIIRHRVFTLSTFLIFNFFFAFAGRSFILLLPAPLPYLFPIAIAVCSSLWLYRTWKRSPQRYQRESLAARLRKQLNKLHLDTAQFLDGRTLEDLSADEIYVLAKVLPDFSQEKRLQTYKAMLRDALDEGYVDPADSKDSFQQMRQELGISDQDHDRILTELGQQYPDLFDPGKFRSRENVLRLNSYRNGLLEAILHSWKNHPDHAKVAELMQAFSKNSSSEVLEDILNSLDTSDRNLVKQLRQEYSITNSDETDALKSIDPHQLWQMIAERIGLLQYLSQQGEDQLHQIFRQIDADGSGYISLDELQTYITAIDPNFTTAQISEMLKRADTSGNDQISYEEFQAVFRSLTSETKAN